MSNDMLPTVLRFKYLKLPLLTNLTEIKISIPVSLLFYRTLLRRRTKENNITESTILLVKQIFCIRNNNMRYYLEVHLLNCLEIFSISLMEFCGHDHLIHIVNNQYVENSVWIVKVNIVEQR